MVSMLHETSNMFLKSESERHSDLSDSVTPWTIPWNFPGQNTGVGSLSLLQGIFPTQGSNPGHPHCMQILYQLSRKGCPRILEWEAYPFSSPFLAHCKHLVKLVHLLSPSHLSQKCFYLGHQRTPFWTPGDGSKNSLHTHPSPLPHHAGIKGQRDCLWELALTAVLGKEITALVPTRSQIAPSSKRTGVMEQGGQNWGHGTGRAKAFTGISTGGWGWCGGPHHPAGCCQSAPLRFWPPPQHTSPLPCRVQKGSGPARLSSAAPTHPSPWCSPPQVWPEVEYSHPSAPSPPCYSWHSGQRNTELGKSRPSQVSNFSSVWKKTKGPVFTMISMESSLGGNKVSQIRCYTWS